MILPVFYLVAHSVSKRYCSECVKVKSRQPTASGVVQTYSLPISCHVSSCCSFSTTEDSEAEELCTEFVLHGRRFDKIICNPDFEFGLAALYIAARLLSTNENARAIFILPSDYFDSSKARARLYRLLHLRLEKEYRVVSGTL